MSQRLRLAPGRCSVLPDAAGWTTTHIADRHGGRRRGWSSVEVGDVGGRPRRLARI